LGGFDIVTQREPFISVIVPVYNTGNDIDKNIKSLAAQTYKNFEVIFVDDFSTDNTIDILIELLNESVLNYKIIYNSKNEGVSFSRNNGIKHSTGDYIYFLDSDDFIEENAFECMVSYIKNEEVELVFGGFDRINKKGRTFFKYEQRFKYHTGAREGNVVLKGILHNEQWIAVGTSMFKKSIINKFSILFTEGVHNGEDQEFIMKFLCHSSRVFCCNRVVLHYYQRPNSISNSKSLRRVTVANAFDNIYCYIKKHNGSEELLNIIKTRKLPIEVIKNIDQLPAGWIHMELPNGLTLEYLKRLLRPFKISNYGLSEIKLIFKIKLFLFSPKLFSKVINWNHEFSLTKIKK
jgi:glycosyltransferase involved in cell wall biosynthesis